MDTAAATALGPRLAGRLTPELILQCSQYMNCIGKYEIDFRGNKIGAIENLGVTEDQFDSMDFSDNAIVFLEGFPKLNRLNVLLMNNNRITRIGRNLQDSIPNLRMLILTNNKIETLQALEPLRTMPNLQHLSLLGNPVTKISNYRRFVIQLCPRLTVLDFAKVKAKERETEEASNVFDPNEQVQMSDGDPSKSRKKNKPTPEQLIAIKAAIQNAGTLEEVRQLEAALKSGTVPSHLTSQPSVETILSFLSVIGDAGSCK